MPPRTITRRILNCSACGRPGIYWNEKYNSLTRKTDVIKIDSRDNLPHICDGSLSSMDLDATKTILSDMMMNNSHQTITEIEEAGVQARSLMEVKLQEAETLINSTTQNIIREVPALFERVVKELVPVEHNITITYQYANGNSSKFSIKNTRPHRQFQDVLSIAQLRQPQILVGGAGSGKTTVGRQAAEVLDLPSYSKTMWVTMSQWDLVGHMSPDGSRYVPGFLREPYENGGVVTLNELDNSNASALVGINDLIEGDSYDFPDGKTIKRHGDFILMGTANTYGRGADRIYVGRQKLDGATLNRFFICDFDYDEDAEFDWAGNPVWTRYIQALRHAANDGRMELIISPRASIYGARMLKSGIPVDKVCQGLLWNHMSISDRAKLESIVGRISI